MSNFNKKWKSSGEELKKIGERKTFDHGDSLLPVNTPTLPLLEVAGYSGHPPETVLRVLTWCFHITVFCDAFKLRLASLLGQLPHANGPSPIIDGPKSIYFLLWLTVKWLKSRWLQIINQIHLENCLRVRASILFYKPVKRLSEAEIVLPSSGKLMDGKTLPFRGVLIAYGNVLSNLKFGVDLLAIRNETGMSSSCKFWLPGIIIYAARALTQTSTLPSSARRAYKQLRKDCGEKNQEETKHGVWHGSWEDIVQTP